MGFLAILSIFAGIFLWWAIYFTIKTYNHMVSLHEVIERSWANIDIVLKQRFDEVPQIITICEQYAEYEQATFDKIIEARKTFLKATTDLAQKIESSKQCEVQFEKLLAVVEAYPNLKANENFLYIQKRLSDFETMLGGRREFLNDAITTYNILIQQFPEIILAKIIRKKEIPLFKVDEKEKVKSTLGVAY